ncbi:hypothetical protein TP2_14480 [Thioclava pacifica DSM 10166]|uniref:Uncharacterized protein n=2 Tax=Thioclava pacifica TaxID=285109 RepID=A0A074IZC1_9RHOB|nr:hypothetical protein TP2_14480 [Thioclava pacifica DSM 10166]
MERVLDDLHRASADLAHAEAAEIIARHRLGQLDEMIAGCEDDAAMVDAETAQALMGAAEGLREERDSLVATLPLELGFHADRRDAASAQIQAAQRKLRTMMQMPEHFGCLAEDRELLAQAREAVRLDARMLADSARQEARARVSDGLAAMPLTPHPQGDLLSSVAGAARRLVDEARDRSC